MCDFIDLFLIRGEVYRFMWFKLFFLFWGLGMVLFIDFIFGDILIIFLWGEIVVYFFY